MDKQDIIDLIFEVQRGNISASAFAQMIIDDRAKHLKNILEECGEFDEDSIENILFVEEFVYNDNED
jgi:hypothetical protein